MVDRRSCAPAIGLLGCFVAVGCSADGCDDIGHAALTATLAGDVGGRCEASVVAVDGDESFPMLPEGDPDDCLFVLWMNRPGTYVVVATSGGHTAESDPIAVRKDGCAVRQRSVRLSL